MVARIAIDARYGQNPISGIGRYTVNLLAGIAENGAGHEFTLLVSKNIDLPRIVVQSGVFEFVTVSGNPHDPWNQISLRPILRRLRIDLLHSPDAFAPLLWRQGKVLLTVHDLIPLICRRLFHSGLKSRFAMFWRFWLKLQCSRADEILTVSRQSASDLTRYLRVPPGKIHVVLNGVGPMNVPTQEQKSEMRRQFELHGKIVLYVGRRDPTKNLALLVRAFSLVRSRFPQDVTLVIAGQPDRRYREAEYEAEKCGVTDRVVYTGHLNETMLAALYLEADVLAFPSIYEGFGLPILEAIHFGTPVVASDIPVFSEVLGDAGILVDPKSAGAWADAIYSVLNEPNLSRSLSKKGLERVRKMTARHQAARTIELYDAILSVGDDQSANPVKSASA